VSDELRGSLTKETLVDDRYRVITRIGSGGMADVYCAEDTQLGRRVALKLLHRRFAEDQEFVERFRREASAAAGLQHPNVVQVYDRGAWDGTYYIAMEFLDGRSLKQIIREEGPLDPQRAVDIAIQILKALRFAHKRGVIHRDIKPHNVIVDAEDRVKVTDFGIARAGASDMTETGAIMGTAQYLSPEQAQGHAVSATTDLYSVGIVLYEMVTGRIPFEADSAVTIALKQVRDDPPAPRALNPDVSPELEDIVLRALRKDPRERFVDADDFIRALESVRDLPARPDAAQRTGRLTGVYAPVDAALPLAPIPAGDPVYEEYVEAERRDRRWMAVLLAVLLLAGAGVAAYLLLKPKQLVVPNVVGLASDTAAARLNNTGFDVQIQTVRSADVPRDRVTRQDPSPGERADEGSTVTVYVSGGPGERSVPDVIGRPQREADAALRKAGFRVAVEKENSDTVDKGRVIETRPSPRTQLTIGRTVSLVVSRGPEEVTVPDVKGLDRDEARRRLTKLNLDVAVTEKETADTDPGKVVEQDPAPSTDVPKGSTVNLMVAKEPAERDVPDVIDADRQDAIDTLQEAGFKVRITEQAVTTPDQDGVVLDQNPPSGEKRKKGARVTITVGRFDDSGLNPEPSATPTPASTP
jgi:serine/threonine-protein kinase